MPVSDDSGGGLSSWLRRWWRALLAELVATALLVWLGIAAMILPMPPDKAPLTHPAMAFGFVVVGNAVAFGPVSGAHMNPAVTLAALMTRRLRPAAAAGYVLAQLLGGVLGFGLLMGTMHLERPAGCTQPNPALQPWAAAVLEAGLTGLLAMACCGVWDAPPDATAPLKLGLLVTGLVYAGGEATGASLNPARSFAPALLYSKWETHWVYWVGPLGGAALGALLHCALSPPRARAPAESAPAHELTPLADKP